MKDLYKFLSVALIGLMFGMALGASANIKIVSHTKTVTSFVTKTMTSTQTTTTSSITTRCDGQNAFVTSPRTYQCYTELFKGSQVLTQFNVGYYAHYNLDILSSSNITIVFNNINYNTKSFETNSSAAQGTVVQVLMTGLQNTTVNLEAVFT